jgi:hypothetical protein
MSQDTKSINTINESNPDSIIKKEQYPELLEKVIPLIKSENKLIKRAAYDFYILLTSAINDNNNEIFKYLNDAIKHVIEHFSKELLDLINNTIDTNFSINNVHYGLLNDISKVIMQQMLFKNKLEEFNDFLMSI